jgi:hypothetical protein
MLRHHKRRLPNNIFYRQMTSAASWYLYLRMLGTARNFGQHLFVTLLESRLSFSGTDWKGRSRTFEFPYHITCLNDLT